MDQRCDVLILTSSFGMGHNSAAKAIEEQLNEENPALRITTTDLLDVSNPLTKNAFFEIYRILSRKQPKIYNYFYNLKRDYKNNYLDEMMYNVYLEKVGDYIQEVSPKLIISTFPLCSGFVSRVKERYGLDIPLVTSITDVVDSWEWIHNKTDMYFVPCKVVEEKLMDKGIPQEKIKITGIPVKKEFLENDRQVKKTRQLLIMAGALENTEKTLKLLRSIDQLDHLKTVVITGQNKEMYRKLMKAENLKNVEIIGYTDQVARFMDESDLIVTKPGGATLFEAINKGIPLVLKSTQVEQEEANVNFVVNKGLGMLIDDDNSLEDLLLESLQNREQLDKFRQNIEELRMELEPEKVGQYALELI